LLPPASDHRAEGEGSRHDSGHPSRYYLLWSRGCPRPAGPRSPSVLFRLAPVVGRQPPRALTAHRSSSHPFQAALPSKRHRNASSWRRGCVPVRRASPGLTLSPRSCWRRFHARLTFPPRGHRRPEPIPRCSGGKSSASASPRRPRERGLHGAARGRLRRHEHGGYRRIVLTSSPALRHLVGHCGEPPATAPTSSTLGARLPRRLKPTGPTADAIIARAGHDLPCHRISARLITFPSRIWLAPGAWLRT